MGLGAESGWFSSTSEAAESGVAALEVDQPEEGKDWNTYFQYEAHKVASSNIAGLQAVKPKTLIYIILTNTDSIAWS